MSHKPYVPSVYVPGQHQQHHTSQSHASNGHQSYGQQQPPSAYAPHGSQIPTASFASVPVQSSAPPSTGANTLPPFGQALNHPAPKVSSTTPIINPSGPYVAQASPIVGYAHASSPSETPVVVGSVIPSQHSSVAQSANYAGLPSGGLVSEGNPVKCHKVDYEIKGTTMQLVEIQLDPGETVIAEAGAMMFLEDGVDFKAKLGDGSDPKQGFFGKLFAAGGRILTGESLFLTHFTNKASQMPQRVAFAAPYPGTILPINMADLSNETLICQKDAFLCAAKGTKLSLHFNRRIGSGLFGGEGFILQKLKGDGMAFVHAGGTVIRRELRGERMRIDTGCVVAFTDGVKFDITFVPGLKSILFGGEGLFLATLQGHGTIWMQSLPFSRMCDRILAAAPSAGGSKVGEGTPLTGKFGDFIDGDGFGGALGVLGGF